MRVVLDTTIFLSTLITPNGSTKRLTDAWIKGRFTLIRHPIQIDELRVASRRDKIRMRVRAAAVGSLVNQISAFAEMPKRLPSVARSPDRRDDFLLAVCEAGHADRLVTGDKADLLALKRHGPTTIVTAAAFAADLGL